jgi:hypothetical protein
MTKTPAPKIYSSTIAPDNNIWVMGSVDGVKIAPIMVAARITYFHCFSISRLETIPNIPKIT